MSKNQRKHTMEAKLVPVETISDQIRPEAGESAVKQNDPATAQALSVRDEHSSGKTVPRLKVVKDGYTINFSLDHPNQSVAMTEDTDFANGIIIKRDVNPGQTVAVTFEAKTLFTIANDLRGMEVHGKIDEADVGQLKVGQTARFTVDAYPDRTFSGQVLQIRKSPEVVQNVVTYTAIISAPNPDLLLLPGMTAQLRIVVSDTGDTLKIPSQALRFRPNGAGLAADRQNANQATSSEASATVWLVGENGRPEPIAVRLGASDDNSTALLEGRLSEGQQLIVGVANAQKQRGYFGLRLGF